MKAALLDINEWDFYQDLVLEIGGLGPCVGIVLYNPKQKAAFAGHFADCEVDGLKDMVEEAVKDFKMAEIKAYAFGNSLDNSTYRNYMKKDREFVRKLLTENNLVNVIYAWSQDFCSMEFELNLKTQKNVLTMFDEENQVLAYRGKIEDFEKSINEYF